MKFIFLFSVLFCAVGHAAEISFTMDDPNTKETPLFSPTERNEKILAAFDQFHIQGALFVCGMRVDNQNGKDLLSAWDRKGHIIANHSYSHLSLNSDNVTVEVYKSDFLKNEPLVTGYKNFRKLYRFPFLKEGDTTEKRDAMRSFLQEHRYKNGYVTIDASDWYVDERLINKLKIDPNADVKPYRDFYLNHMWKRATYYNDLAKKLTGREIKHTILIHHNLLNALFLGDLMKMFQDKGWKLISVNKAFTDSIYKSQPNVTPAGESLIWELAKETKRFDDILRYPGEDSEYEKVEMDRLGL